MATVGTSSKIALALKPCLQRFHPMVIGTVFQPYDSEVPHALWQDELRRLRVWAANIGAHHKGQMSLDYRLRDASHIQNQVVGLLESYHRTLQDLEDFLNLQVESSQDDLLLDDDWGIETGSDGTELQEIYKTVVQTTDCLFQISILIRKPAQHDRLFGSKREDAAGFERFDLDHVSHKFPNVDKKIVERLGMANSRRRREFKYRQRHHAKLSKGIAHAHEENDGNTTVISPTEFSIVTPDEVDFHDVGSDSGQSAQTSVAMSLFSSKDKMTIPPPPSDSKNERPFECPYCFFIITVRDTRDWGRHVLRDISPYVCIFSDCDTPKRLYPSRNDWWRHTKAEYDLQAQSRDGCPLCGELGVPKVLLQKHLGRHLEELALFAIPRGYADSEDREEERNEEKVSNREEPGTVLKNLETPAVDESSASTGDEELRSNHEDEEVDTHDSAHRPPDLSLRQDPGSDYSDIHLEKPRQHLQTTVGEIPGDDGESANSLADATQWPWKNSSANLHGSSFGNDVEQRHTGDAADNDEIAIESYNDRYDASEVPIHQVESAVEEQPRDIPGHVRRDSARTEISVSRELRGPDGNPAHLRPEQPHRDLRYSQWPTQESQSGIQVAAGPRKEVPTPVSTPLAAPAEAPDQTHMKQPNKFSLLDDEPPETTPPNQTSPKGIRSQVLLPPALSSLPHVRRLPSTLPTPSLTPLSRSMGHGASRVSFTNSTQVTRQPYDDEKHVMSRFARHASHCVQCNDPVEAYQSSGTLCESGNKYARDVAQYIYSKNGVAYSSVDRQQRQEKIQIEIPASCAVIKTLCKAVDQGLTLKRDKPKFVDHRTSPVERRPVERRDDYEPVIIQPISSREEKRRHDGREKKNEKEKRKSSVYVQSRGSLYEQDEAEKRQRSEDHYHEYKEETEGSQ